jgi:hypothetical protein
VIKIKLFDVPDDIEIGLWAHENCPSFTGWVVIGGETLDDFLTTYKFYFNNEQDAVLFQLRWQGQ